MKIISIIIPVYNEGFAIESNLDLILEHLLTLTSLKFQIILIDDGSIDNTCLVLKKYCIQYDNIELISFNRNFGKEAAIYAGLKYARGDAAIVMDSDLQHPPTFIPKMLQLWENGIDIVEAHKQYRGQENLLSKGLALGFYSLFHLLAGIDIKNQTDFKLLDRKVINAYCELPERKRFFRGLIAWMSFPSARLFFDVPERKHGQSTWSKLKLFKFSISAITSFSSMPLHIITILGVICFILSILLGSFSLYLKYIGEAVDGFTTVILLILILGSFIMFGLGLIGVYIEQMFDEIKKRPIYFINQKNSFMKQKSE